MNDSSLYSTDTLCLLTKLEVDGPKFVSSNSTTLLRYQVFFNPSSRASASCWLFPSGTFPQGHKCLNEEEREEFSFLPFVDRSITLFPSSQIPEVSRKVSSFTVPIK